MLVLTRREGDAVVIDVPPGPEARRIVVHYVRDKGGDARWGFAADRSIRIVRAEILTRRDAGRAEGSE